MDSISFRMAGSGNWQKLLPDEEARSLYARIYPEGVFLRQVDDNLRDVITSWQKAGIATIVNQRLVPLGPIMTDRDIDILVPWFQGISTYMCQAVSRCLADYRLLAESLCGGIAAPKHKVDNLVTILTCGEALDMWTFTKLRQELLGPHPVRGSAGRFFFWGYAFSNGPKRIFGVTTYGGIRKPRLSVIRSHGLDRGSMPALLRQESVLNYLTGLCLSNEAALRGHQTPHEVKETARSLRRVGLLMPEEPPHLAIPVLSDRDMEKAAHLHNKVSADITSDFATRMGKLQRAISRCSFAECSPRDVLTMMFHLSYSYAADALVLTGAIPEFPQQAGGEWGVWLRLAEE